MAMSIGAFIETYRGENIYCRAYPVPGGFPHERDYVYVGVNIPGIWFTLQGLRDYIDWRKGRR